MEKVVNGNENRSIHKIFPKQKRKKSKEALVSSSDTHSLRPSSHYALIPVYSRIPRNTNKTDGFQLRIIALTCGYISYQTLHSWILLKLVTLCLTLKLVIAELTDQGPFSTPPSENIEFLSNPFSFIEYGLTMFFQPWNGLILLKFFPSVLSFVMPRRSIVPHFSQVS